MIIVLSCVCGVLAVALTVMTILYFRERRNLNLTIEALLALLKEADKVDEDFDYEAVSFPNKDGF